MFVDLHVHSVFSDGCLTPAELVRDALRANVSFAALADHNTIAGCAAMRAACAEAKIRCIDAVEIDSLYHGEDLHILSYGADSEHAAFSELVRYSREMLDKMSTDLIGVLEKEGKNVSMADYLLYPEQKGRGGWKALYYLQECGVGASKYDIFPLYDQYGVTYAKAGFADAEEVIRLIHAAGGLAVLAHPGDVNRLDRHIEANEMAAQMQMLFEAGLDGAECHYPKHSEEETRLFCDICTKNKKLITSGSDCHGAFSGKPVGYMKKKKEDLMLDELWRRSMI